MAALSDVTVGKEGVAHDITRKYLRSENIFTIKFDSKNCSSLCVIVLSFVLQLGLGYVGCCGCLFEYKHKTVRTSNLERSILH